MDWKGIVILVTALLGIFAFLGMLYDGWSSMKNAGTDSEKKQQIKKDLIRNIIFGAVILFLVISVESGIFYGLLG